MAKSVDPDATAHFDPSHLNLYGLLMYLYRSTGLKELNVKQPTTLTYNFKIQLFDAQ